jgi:arylsulfatase A-like enzyme
MYRIAGVLTVGVLISGCGSTEKKASFSFDKQPNIVLIAVDDLNNWVGIMEGKAKTPAIDKMASEGVLFKNAFCAVPACNPSRTALFTGQRPETTGQFQNEGNFRTLPGGSERVTLPQRLSAEGYHSVAAGKLFHSHRGTADVAAERSDDISWDFQWRGTVGTPGHHLFLNEKGWAKWLQGAESEFVKDGYVNSGMSYIAKFGVWGAIPHAKEECGDWKVAQFGVDFVQEEHDKPFFLGLGIFRPHSPQIVPQEFIDMYPLDSIELPELPADDMDDVPGFAQVNWSSPFVKLVHQKGQLPNAVQGYLASCSFADACIGHFMEALDKSKYRNNTIVILVTDHGFQLGHKNRWEKFSLWRQGTNVPLIIRMPAKMSKPGVASSAVSMLDIYPTVMELLGIEPPHAMEGESLVPFLHDANYKRTQPAIVTWERGSHSVVRDGWNYIHYKDGSEELYNQNEDPDEYKNLASDVRYRTLMDELKSFIPADYSGEKEK